MNYNVSQLSRVLPTAAAELWQMGDTSLRELLERRFHLIAGWQAAFTMFVHASLAGQRIAVLC